MKINEQLGCQDSTLLAVRHC